jgi:hypothetical protein
MQKFYSIVIPVAWVVASLAQSMATPSDNVFRSADSTVEFRYPKSMVLCYPEQTDTTSKNERGESCSPYLDICAIGTTTTAAGTLHPETVACVAYPHSAYEGTNFGGAAFSVSEVPDARTESQCLQFDKFTINKKTVHWETIRSMKFKAASGGEGGLGHGLAADVYLTFHNGKCYDVELRETQTSLANFDPGTVKEFKGQAKVSSELRRVLHSFHFLK